MLQFPPLRLRHIVGIGERIALAQRRAGKDFHALVGFRINDGAV